MTDKCTLSKNITILRDHFIVTEHEVNVTTVNYFF